MGWRGWTRAAALAAVAGVAGCDVSDMAVRSNSAAATSWGDRMRARQVAVVRPPILGAPSRADSPLRSYYAGLQDDLLARGYLRTDDGSRDARYDADSLTRDFLTIALREEYKRGQGLTRSDGESTTLARWSRPVRLRPQPQIGLLWSPRSGTRR